MGVGDPVDDNEEDMEFRDLSRTLETPSRTLGNHCMGVGDPLDEDKRTWRSETSLRPWGHPRGPLRMLGTP